MLEPRPEIRIATRLRGCAHSAIEPAIDDAGVAARHDAADRRHRLAGLLQHGRDLRGLARRHDQRPCRCRS